MLIRSALPPLIRETLQSIYGSSHDRDASMALSRRLQNMEVKSCAGRYSRVLARMSASKLISELLHCSAYLEIITFSISILQYLLDFLSASLPRMLLIYPVISSICFPSFRLADSIKVVLNIVNKNVLFLINFLNIIIIMFSVSLFL